jgi:phosphoribulokinase
MASSNFTVKMPKEGFSVVTITQEAYDKAHAQYSQKLKSKEIEGKSFSRFVNDIIIERIEADQNLSLHAPYMQKVGMQDNSIMIKDNKLSRIVEVQIRGKDLICMLDEKKDCVHVGYAYAIPDVYRIMSERKR